MEVKKLQAFIGVGRFGRNSVVNFYLQEKENDSRTQLVKHKIQDGQLVQANKKVEVIARYHDVDGCYFTANLGENENYDNLEQWMEINKENETAVQIPVSFLKHALKSCKDVGTYELEVTTELIKGDTVPVFRFMNDKYDKKWRVNDNTFFVRDFDMEFDKKIAVGFRACKSYIMEVSKACPGKDEYRRNIKGVNVRMKKVEVEGKERNHVEFIANNGHYLSSFRIPYEWDVVSNMEDDENFTIPLGLLDAMKKFPEKTFDALSLRYFRNEDDTNVQMSIWSGSLGMTIKVNQIDNMPKYPEMDAVLNEAKKGEYYPIHFELEKLKKDLAYQKELFGMNRTLVFRFDGGDVVLSDYGKVHSYDEDFIPQEIERYSLNGSADKIPEDYVRGYNSSYLSNALSSLQDRNVCLEISAQESGANALRIQEGTLQWYMMGLRLD